ncbi:DUF11 domain-containing protein [Actinomycetaceae bacterium TAE3-ERU4]|nr:DUF11 domain-containing protein [Actinomycetaceae bacterium TAE3-ERU4]
MKGSPLPYFMGRIRFVVSLLAIALVLTLSTTIPAYSGIVATANAAEETIPAPGKTLRIPAGDGGFVDLSMRLKSAGRGGVEGVKPCFLSAAAGYPQGDNSVDDGKSCIAELEEYEPTWELTVSSATANEPISFYVNPKYFTNAIPENGLPWRKPVLKFPAGSTPAVTVEENKESKLWKFTVLPNQTGNTYYSMKMESKGNSYTGKYLGAFEISTDALAQEKEVITSDRENELLGKLSSDLTYANSSVSPHLSYYEGKKYVKLKANYTAPGAMPEEIALARPFIGAEHPDLLLDNRFKLTVLPIPGITSSEKVYALIDGERHEMRYNESDGSWTLLYPAKSYKDGLSPEILVPMETLPDNEDTKITFRLDPVDENGELTKLRSDSGLSEIPLLASDNPKYGLNIVDPGANQACDVSSATGAKVRFYKADVEGINNNNCGQATISLNDYKCSDGCKSEKNDGLFDQGKDKRRISTEDGSAYISNSVVKLTIRPEDAGNNPKVCVTWEPGVQAIKKWLPNGFTGTPQVPFMVNATGGNTLAQAFPGVKIYRTTKNLIRESNGKKSIDCSDSAAQWEKTYEKGIINNAVDQGIDIADISGFMFEFPGKLETSFDLLYLARRNKYDVTSAQRLLTDVDNGAEYYKLPNYMRVKNGEADWSDTTSSFFLSPKKPSVLFDGINSRNGLFDAINSGTVDNTLAPRIIFRDHIEGIVDGVDDEGNPLKITSRIYLSKCLRVDETSVAASHAVYHALPEEKYSTNPKDCGVDPNHYIERVWSASAKPNTTDDFSNDPFFTEDWVNEYRNSADSSIYAYPQDNNQDGLVPFKIKYISPDFGIPNQSFPAYPEVFLPGGNVLSTDTVDGETVYKLVPQGKPIANSYYNLGNNATTIRLTTPTVTQLLASNRSDVPEAGVDDNFKHTAQLVNSTETLYGETEYIDLLPYNGDPFGTHFNGKYWLDKMPENQGSVDKSKVRVFYTTDDPTTVSLCPQGALPEACNSRVLRDIDKTPSATVWKELTPEILESLKGPGGDERITALRFVSEELGAKQTMRFQMTYATEGNRKGDVYASTMGSANLKPSGPQGEIRTLQRPEVAKTKVIYRGKITGNVYLDGDRNNAKGTSEEGLKNYTVELLNDKGEVIRRTVTNSKGDYFFERLEAGTYSVKVILPNGREANTQAGAKPSDIGSAIATGLVLKEGTYGADGEEEIPPITAVNNVDFGITLLVPSITLNKVIGSASSEVTTATGELNSPVTFTVFGANTGDLPLTEVRLNDTWAEGLSKAPLDQTCVIKDSASADVTVDRGDLTSESGATLQPQDTYECTSTYSVTQDDIDAGSELVNKASISGKSGEEEVSAPEKTVKVTIPGNQAITLSRDVVLPDGVNASEDNRLVEGDKIHYTYTITNTGNKTIREVSLTDAGVPGFDSLVCKQNGEVVDLSKIALAPNAVVTCETPEVTVDKALVAKQSVTTTPTVTGKAGSTTAPIPLTATVNPSTQYLGTPALSLNKSVKDKAPKYRAGQTVTYEFVVTNTGNTRLDKAKLADPMEGLQLTCPEGYENLLSAEGMTLPMGGNVTCTGTYEVTQSDVDNHNELPNTATATAGLRNSPALSQTSSAVVELDNTASIAVEIGVKDKRAANDPYVEGDELVYTYTITNDGLATLKNITLTDQFAAGKGLEPVCTKDGQPVKLSEITLAPGENISCESPKYTLTADDITADRTIDNSVVATGVTLSENSPKKVTSGDPKVSVPTAVPAIGLNKTVVDPKAAYVAGDKVTYNLVVTNQGVTKLTGVKLVDAMPEIEELSCPLGHESLLSENGGELNVNESVTCTAKYTVTQDNVDKAKALVNSAKVVGVTRNAPQVSATSEVPINFSSEKSISLIQTVVPSAPGEGPESVDGKYVAGDKVVHEYLITNTGSVTLNNLKLDKGHVDGTLVCHLADDESVNVNLDTFALAPGQAIKCTSTHVVTAEEATNPTLANPSTVTGTPVAGGAPVDSTSPVAVNLGQPAISLVKNVKDRKDAYRAGEVVTYEFTIANVGNTELNNVKLVDSMEGLKLSCPAGFEGLLSEEGMTLPAAGTEGANVVCTGTYKLIQATVDAGADIPNTASISGALRGVHVEGSSSASVAVSKNKSIDLVQSVSPSAPGEGPDSVSGNYVEGDTVNYTYVITNTGDVTLKNLRLDKGHTDGTLVCVTNDDEAANVNLDIATLAPGKSIKCTSSHVVTKEEVVAGSVLLNPATVKALPLTGEGEVTDVTETEVALAIPAVSLVKQVEGKKDSYVAGDEVKYSFVIANQGKTKLEGVKLTDPLEGVKLNCPEAFSDLLTDKGATLAPLGKKDSSVTCTGTYTLTQADMDKMTILGNTATVNAGLRNSAPLAVESSAQVALNSVAKLSLKKEIRNLRPTGYQVGDKLTYVITVKNEGTVTLAEPKVADKMLSDRGVELNCPAKDTLAPGESFSCVSSEYTLEKNEATGKDLVNTATVTAKSSSSTGAEELKAKSSVAAKTIVPPQTKSANTPQLAITGADAATYGGSALVLLLIGGGFLIVARRKKEHSE